MTVVLPDFSRHGQFWGVDLDAKELWRLPKAEPKSDASSQPKGFVKHFAFGGPLAVVDTGHGCLAIWQSHASELTAIKVAGRWSPLITRLKISIGATTKLFVDISLLDAFVFHTDPTWDAIDSR